MIRVYLAILSSIFAAAPMTAAPYSGSLTGDSITPGMGNLAEVARKIRAGQPVKAGFLGGSITLGVGVKDRTQSYYSKTSARLSDFAKSSGANLETILAGLAVIAQPEMESNHLQSR